MKKLFCILTERALFALLLFIPGFASAPALADPTEQSGHGDGYDYAVLGDTYGGATTVVWEDKNNNEVWIFKFDQYGNQVGQYRMPADVPAVGGVDPSPEDSGKGTEPHNPGQEIASAIREAMLHDKDG